MKAEFSIYFQKWLKVRVKFDSEKEAIEAVKQNGYALRYVKDQTEPVCLEAVKQDWDALQYVWEIFFKEE